jgi:hypothetical protein
MKLHLACHRINSVPFLLPQVSVRAREVNNSGNNT